MSRRRMRMGLVLPAMALVVAAVVLLMILNRPDRGGDATGDEQASVNTSSPIIDEAPVRETSTVCPGPTVRVADSAHLDRGLDAAGPGDVIGLAPGVHERNFTASAAGTAGQPIVLCGTTDSILDGGTTDKGYVLHVENSSHWVLGGFSVRNGQKGVVVGRSAHILLMSTLSDVVPEIVFPETSVPSLRSGLRSLMSDQLLSAVPA